jgi:hypothetical protein
VPEIIWRSPREVIVEFLAAYFETDGWVGHGGGAGVVSKDEQLIRDTQRLLLLFGIVSSVHSVIARAQNGFEGLYWRLLLRRAAIDVFAKEIGFRSARKCGRIAEIVSKPHSNAFRPLAWAKEIASIESCAVEPVDLRLTGSVFTAAGFVSHGL